MHTVLALETSCDESAAAVVRHKADGSVGVLASQIASQVEEHALWGGVVPEIASRRHVEALPALVQEVLRESALSISELNASFNNSSISPSSSFLSTGYFSSGIRMPHCTDRSFASAERFRLWTLFLVTRPACVCLHFNQRSLALIKIPLPLPHNLFSYTDS